MEKWLPIPGYEGRYEVSDLGRVRSLARKDSRGRSRRERILRGRPQAKGHLAVALYADGVRCDQLIHWLVLLAFVGPRPEGMDACHWNDEPADNRLANLRWDTRAANIADSVRNGGHAMASRTHCPSGHEYTAENTYLYPRGSRACNECRRIYRETHADERRAKSREYMRRKRAEAKKSKTTREKAA